MGITERRREELVRAAFNQIAGRGFEGLRTREVAAEVGVNIATLHYYFPTKESLIRGVVEHAMGRFRSTLAPHGSPSDQLRNHLRAVRKLLADEPALGSVMGELALRSARDKSVAAITAGEATLTVGRRRERVGAIELSQEAGAAFFRDVLGPYVRRIPLGFGRWMIGSVLGAKDILDDPSAAAERHPVFEVRAAD